MIAKNIRRMDMKELVELHNRYTAAPDHVEKFANGEEALKKVTELLIHLPADEMSQDEMNVYLTETPDHQDVLKIQASLSGLFPIGLSKVRSVYSGKAGRCCCGCSGKHYYASQLREVAGQHRGYPIEDDEISDRMVQKVVRMINEVITSAINGTDSIVDGVIDTIDDDFASIRVGERLYIAYWGD